MYLSKEQIKQIENRVRASEVEEGSLFVDIVDHMCCSIEERMDNGNSFEQALREVFEIFDRKHIEDIKIATLSLTQNKFIMKKRTTIIGGIAVATILAGVLFKQLHLMGADIVFGFGILLLCFGFFLSLMLDKVTILTNNTLKLASILGFLGVSAVILGTGLTFLRFPIAPYLIGFGSIFLVLYYLIINVVKNATNKSK